MTMRTLTLLAGVATLSACAVGPDYRPPVQPLAAAYQAPDGIDTTAGNADWWSEWRDPALAALVGEALAANTDLAQSAARIDRARAAAQAAGAALLPTLDATGGVTTLSQSRETAIGRVTQTLGLPRGYTEYSTGAQASWEIDLFGGLRRRREAARADLAAAHADDAAARIAIAAETADAYCTLRAYQARLAVAEQQERNQATLVDVVRQRFDQGIAAEREYNRAAAALSGVRAINAPLRAGIEAQLNRIDVLTGTAPGTHRAGLAQPMLIPVAPVPAGSAAPADLLRRRPDIAAAERRLAASNARIGAAIADYYPSISLSGLVGVASLGTSSLFTSSAVQASGIAGLRWRLFDFGRVDAEVADARGARAEALAAWRGSVLKAAEDVETALARLAAAHAARTALEDEVAKLTRARAQAQDAYGAGVVALIDVTDADRELLTASDKLESAKADEARGAIAVYRALGGGWSADSGRNMAGAADTSQFSMRGG